MHKRLETPELLDLGPTHYTRAEYRDCLLQLDRIGRFLMGNRATFKAFQQLAAAPRSILEVGCGSGQLAMQLARRYPRASVTGIDIAPEAIEFAQEQLKLSPLPNVNFRLALKGTLDEPPKSYDVVTATLVVHHLSDAEIVEFLKTSMQVAQTAVIINDLHRHILAEWGFRAIAPICFRNRLIEHDGLISIKRAFTRQDWSDYLQAAGIPPQAWSLSWHGWFRWVLMLYPERLPP